MSPRTSNVRGGVPGDATDAAPPGGPGSRAPAAVRARRPGWRNPRLVLGVLLVAGCVLAGSRLLAAAEDTVPVWAVATTLPAGAQVEAADLDVRQVRFPDEQSAAAYVSAAGPVPEGTRVEQEVRAGELLPSAVLGTGPGEPLVEVPLAVAAEDLPATVRQGSRVDVWIGAGTAAERVLDDVEVVAVPSSQDGGLAPAQTRQVIVGVPADRAESALADALGRASEGRVVVTRVG